MGERRQSSVLTVLARVFGAVAAGLLIAAAVLAGVTILSLGDQRATGTVVGFDTNSTGSFEPVIEFTPPGGIPSRFVDPVASRPARYRTGDTVVVRYQAGRPGTAVHDEYWALYLLPTILGIAGGAFGLAATVMAVLRRLRRGVAAPA